VKPQEAYMKITFPKHSKMGRKPKPIEYYINDNDCWICTSHSRSHNGYPYMSLKGKNVRISHYIYKRFKGEIPENHIVMHACDNSACVNPDHLKTGTVDDNIQDKVNKGRQAKGSGNGRAKLTGEQVIAIRKDPRSLRITAREYGVDYTVISNIRRRKTWKHI
jgi:hypothetical protein